MDRGDLVFVVLPFMALALFSVGFVALLRRRWRMDRAALRRAARLVEPDIVTPPRDPGRQRRPWWGNPWLWVGISAGSVVLGLVVARELFGGVFLFIPFVWLSRSKETAVDPRSNGHAKRESPF
jgi:hypothetical protein